MKIWDIIVRRFKKSKPVNKKGWAKIENKSNGPLSWTEYTDEKGFVYTIYNMMIQPGFSGATMTNEKE